MNKNINILIVEDESIASIYLETLLNELGFNNINIVDNGCDAIELAKKEKIDLLFMDLCIKGSLDGIQTSKILNKEHFLPTIYVTGENEINIIHEALETNIFGYITKPFDKSSFIAPFKIALKEIENRKSQWEKDTNFQKNNIVNLGNGYKFNIDKNTCYLNNTPIKLTKKELDLLKILSIGVNSNLSYERIKSVLWANNDVANSTLRDLISRLKKKLPQISITNISNIGYILKRGGGGAILQDRCYL